MKKEWTGERLETGIHSQVTAEHLHRYALAMEWVQDKPVLDIACGEGYGSNLMAQKAKTVTGVDIDETTINKASGKYRRSNLSFLTGTVKAIPIPDNSVEVVTSFETLEHTDGHQQFLTEIKRVLKPGGILIISTPDKKWYSDKTGNVNPHHVKELYHEEFETLLRKNFANVFITGQQFFCGSVILSANNAADYYKGNFGGISKQEQPEAPYMIAVASDAMPGTISQSFFSAADIMEQAIHQKEMDIKNSLSYKLGNFLLAPAKWLKKLLKNP